MGAAVQGHQESEGLEIVRVTFSPMRMPKDTQTDPPLVQKGFARAQALDLLSEIPGPVEGSQKEEPGALCQEAQSELSLEVGKSPALEGV